MRVLHLSKVVLPGRLAPEERGVYRRPEPGEGWGLSAISWTQIFARCSRMTYLALLQHCEGGHTGTHLVEREAWRR